MKKLMDMQLTSLGKCPWKANYNHVSLFQPSKEQPLPLNFKALNQLERILTVSLLVTILVFEVDAKSLS